jgi:hypothetical protein
MKNMILPLIIIAGISSCYPIDDLKVEDLDIAASLYDKTYYEPGTGLNKFQALRTFTVVDTVVHIMDASDEDNISRRYDEFVIEQIRLNMLKLGFTEETNPDVNAPDVAVTISAMSSEHEVYTWYPYWGWYWGYGGYPYKSTVPAATSSYYYYPWYPYTTYYTYQTGSVIMEMVEVARVNPDNDAIPVIWASIVNGVLDESQTNTQNRLSKGIDQCFSQSPYLIKTIE